jgi:ATP-binding cassette subfamily B protein
MPFSTVRLADRIFVIEQGHVLESGSHDELMVLNGRYAELFQLQAAAYRSLGHTYMLEKLC